MLCYIQLTFTVAGLFWHANDWPFAKNRPPATPFCYILQVFGTRRSYCQIVHKIVPVILGSTVFTVTIIKKHAVCTYNVTSLVF